MLQIKSRTCSERAGNKEERARGEIIFFDFLDECGGKGSLHVALLDAFSQMVRCHAVRKMC